MITSREVLEVDCNSVNDTVYTVSFELKGPAQCYLDTKGESFPSLFIMSLHFIESKKWMLKISLQYIIVKVMNETLSTAWGETRSIFD